MMDHKRALCEEAIRLLDISDRPDLYHSIRRWARVHIKHEPVAPIDEINWPKGSLLCGLMHLGIATREADNSKDRAVSILAMASVQSYIDRWIKNGAHLYTVDDMLAGQALLGLAEVYRKEDPGTYDRYMNAARLMMDFLYDHAADREGSLPYRPAHGTGQIFADGLGMAMPFAVRYGLMKGDDEAIELGLRQADNAMGHILDESTGLPWHVYSLADTDDSGCGDGVVREGADDWGRALGWIMFGFGSCMEAYRSCRPDTVTAIRSSDKIRKYLRELAGTAVRYRRDDGTYGSRITDNDSPVDTSASAMILYGLSQNDGENRFDTLIPYIASSGAVLQAQGECGGIGIYSENYGSYPWSVGMTMMLI